MWITAVMNILTCEGQLKSMWITADINILTCEGQLKSMGWKDHKLSQNIQIN